MSAKAGKGRARGRGGEPAGRRTVARRLSETVSAIRRRVARARARSRARARARAIARARELLPTPRQAAIIAAAAIATWLFWGTWATYPVGLFVVFVHECGHAIAAILTGGEVHGMRIDRWLNGATAARGGVALVVLQAGYLASAVFGAGMIVAASRPATARGSLGGLAALTFVCGLAFASPRGATFWFALAAAMALAAVAAKAGEALVRGVLVYLAVVSSLYVLVDLRHDFARAASGSRVTDATLLADRTGIPAVVWVAAWALVSIALFALALQQARRDARRTVALAG